MKAIVLLSGGLDSAVTLAFAQSLGYECHALTFDYGQRHAIELTAAALVARRARVSHAVVSLRGVFSGSALTFDAEVPKDGIDPEVIPVTYVPARNTVFLAVALSHAEVIGARDIFIGVNALDYSGYPDCRPEYIEAFGVVANLGTKFGVEGERIIIHAPLVLQTKVEIVRRGRELGVDLSLTHSCYDPTPDGPCGQCDSCRIREAAFAEVGG